MNKSSLEVAEEPSEIWVQTSESWAKTEHRSADGWTLGDISVDLSSGEARDVFISASVSAIRRVVLRFPARVPQGSLLLGDHWERAYGDLEWRGVVPERVMPWYFLLYDGAETDGFGVKTGAGAMCFWRVDGEFVSLCLDVRNGGAGVRLSGRRLKAATVVTRRGKEGESAFYAARAFCRMLCDTPRLPSFPVYGGNNWYYAYGDSSHDQIVEDAKYVSSLAGAEENRPFMVIDDGWQVRHGADYNGGPWDAGNEKFPDMALLADEIRQAGARPGIWFRPLLTAEAPEEFLLPEARMGRKEKGCFLDPSAEYTLDAVTADIARLRSFGYELIKHDFSTYDMLGRWGMQMGAALTNDGWHFYDTSKTTAEIIRALYVRIRDAASGALLLGCNTVGHLSAGLFELSRTGDDTSGRSWERTRRMGVNALAFRMPQHGSFFAADADCVGITGDIDPALNLQWLRLLAKSGTALFVSVDRNAADAQTSRALKEAFSLAARGGESAEPLDWLSNTCPAEWLSRGQCLSAGEHLSFRWSGTPETFFTGV